MHLKPARRRRALVLLAAVLGLGLGFTVVQPAAAHDRLVSADPEDGAKLDTPPSQVVLTFSGDVLPSGAQVIVSTRDGSVEGEVAVDGAVVTAELPGDLPAGGHDVVWRVVSSDGHPIEGELSYDVAAAAEPATEATQEPEASPSPTSEGQATDAPSPDGERPSGDMTSSAGTDGHEHPTGVPGAELDENGEAGWAASWLFGAAVLALVAVAAAMVLRQRRMRQELDDREPPGDGPEDGPAGR
ncbi:copper resistance CopC family protein [Isoptericola cucumis]|uniref:Copper resistance protein CopC n=1 Tax=Isoptericola cucumis TaxID=1776856 RepID=A0ABQ2BBP4_9MICO|nr:copper resistance CopC family protein [Isoptericola cucumis]GGI11015.1 copper resistance protein CopC [Isoptericola cucumis]